MIALLQRARNASCTVNGNVTGKIDDGLLVYFCVVKGDTSKDLERLVNKIVNFRMFEDGDGKMNLAIKDTSREILFISQFTLSSDVWNGNRPSFDYSEKPEIAEKYYLKAIDMLRDKGMKVECGVFGAMMDIQYENYGPSSFILNTSNK